VRAGLGLLAAIFSVGALFLFGVYVRKAREEALISAAASLPWPAWSRPPTAR
jgi:hypothetical protein